MRQFFIGGRRAADFHRGPTRVTKRRYTSLRDKVTAPHAPRAAHLAVLQAHFGVIVMVIVPLL